MTCEQIREMLGPYLDDEASAEMRSAVDAHVSACRACTQELESLRTVADALAHPHPVQVPPELWDAIKGRLAKTPPHRHWAVFTFRRMAAAAAVLVIAVGLGVFALLWGGNGVGSAEAATIDFGVLLGELGGDASAAFDKFLQQYDAKEIEVSAAARYAPKLNFGLPDVLPGGFRLEKAYALRFGPNPGIAARYLRDGELLGAVFHRPVLKEQYGTYEDRSCIIGKHRGHAVGVGDWTLIHVTDPSTCHCILSRLNPERELPPILALLAPGGGVGATDGHGMP